MGLSDQNENDGKGIIIARRELFDVRTQLMAEDDADDLATDNAELIAGLEQGDLKPNFYEGGFKTWECSLDLADVLLSSTEIGASGEEGVHVIELGCGTAVPSLMLFAQVLLSSTTHRDGRKGRYRFTMADYNSTVLRMVTLSNFLLTWWVNSPASPRVATTAEKGGVDGKEEAGEAEGELDIDASLLDTFQADLERRGIEIDFISGGWSADFVRLALDSATQEAANTSSTLILASETIYSPSSLGVFSTTLLELLRKSRCEDTTRNKSTALIAAKKVYFGVGGGVDEFLQVLDQQPLQDKELVRVNLKREIASGGVKRVVLEIGIE